MGTAAAVPDRCVLSLAYVSQSRVGGQERPDALADIQAVSVARNSACDVTGLLIASPRHFAQLLEGPEPAVDSVMASIDADPRHGQIRIIHRRQIATRQCPLWRMACFDEQTFADGNVSPVLAAAHAGTDPLAIPALERLIRALALELRRD